jgi:hypothetical protein
MTLVAPEKSERGCVRNMNRMIIFRRKSQILLKYWHMAQNLHHARTPRIGAKCLYMFKTIL